MVAITSTELNLLRSRPHETNLWLSIYKPPTVFACRVKNPAAAPGLRIVAYDTVTTGAWTNLRYGMTMYVGTTLGGRDIGRIRIKTADASAIIVAENSDINWADTLYLTVVNFYEINAMYPRMDTPDPADLTQQVWYKDWDLAYTNQNSNLGSLVCMGSHYAGFMSTPTGTCDVYYSASGTLAFELPNSNYSCSWNFEGASITGSTANTPGYVSYGTPGHYTTRLFVTNNNTGATDTSYRHISIYNRPENGTSVPILNWELLSLDGSRDAGGYQGRIKIRESTEDVVDGALIVIFADDAYGGTKGSIGGNAKNRQTIFFVGYILDGSISYNYEDSSVEFNVGSPTEVMKLSQGLVTSVRSSSDPAGEDAVDNDIPSAWALLKDMNCRRAMYHYLRWHSTVMMTNDFMFNGTDQYIEYFDADRESLYDGINNLMKGTLYGDVVCDRQGRIYAEVSVAATDLAASSFPAAMTIFKQEWLGTPVIEESFNYKLSYLEMGGIQFTIAPTGTFGGTSAGYLSCAPGTSPAYRGNVQTLEGLAINSQAYLNDLSGNVFAYLNSKYAHVEFELDGNYRNLDIAPQEIVSVDLIASDTPQKLVWNSKAFHPTGMSWNYNPQKGILLPTLTLHEVTQGYDGTTIIIPPIPPVDIPVVPPVPPFVIPPFVIPTWPTGTSTGTNFMYVPCSYGESDYDSTAYYAQQINQYAGYDGNALGLWMCPFGNDGTAYIYAVVFCGVTVAEDTEYDLTLKVSFCDFEIACWGWTDIGYFTFIHDLYESPAYHAVGPIMLSGLGGTMVRFEIDFPYTNVEDLLICGIYIKWI